MTTYCSKCGIELKETQDTYLSCFKCKRFTPSRHIKTNEFISLKGGDIMSTKAKKEADDETVSENEEETEDVPVKETITSKRVANANKILTFATEDLSLDSAEISKVLSRAYSINKASTN